jgi:hypothetical protein
MAMAAAGPALKQAATAAASNRVNAAKAKATKKKNEIIDPSTKSVKKRDGRSTTEKTTDKASGLLSNRPRYWEPRTVAGYRRILTAEFLVCIGIVVYKAMKNKDFGSTFWRQLGAMWLAFFVLALLSSANWKIARIAAMLGGLVTIVMLLKDSEILTTSFATAQSAFGTAPQSQEGAATDVASGFIAGATSVLKERNNG